MQYLINHTTPICSRPQTITTELNAPIELVVLVGEVCTYYNTTVLQATINIDTPTQKAPMHLLIIWKTEAMGSYSRECILFIVGLEGVISFRPFNSVSHKINPHEVNFYRINFPCGQPSRNQLPNSCHVELSCEAS